ncbi:YLS9 protein [Nymphaea thermarum]|nr:YLS9 protein [Nymphaea thermarum]
MGDYYGYHSNHRPYAMDVEASSAMPNHAPRYVLLSENSLDPSSMRPPPHRRNVPRYPHKKGTSCCCKCYCCCCCFFFLLLVALVGSIAYISYRYQPQIPSYRVKNFHVSKFNVDSELTVFSEFSVEIEAENPNTKIGFHYERGSLVAVTYSGRELCSGKLPVFYQGYKNTTVMHVALTGKSAFGTGLQAALMEQQNTGSVPLTISVVVPVALDLQGVKLHKVTVFVTVSLVVDSLQPNKKILIKSKEVV